MEFSQIISSGAKMLGLTLPGGAEALMLRYAEALTEKNAVMNLTAITEPREMASLHFLDSLAVLTLGGFRGRSVIDVGTGAGFPGLPMKLGCSELELTLLDSLSKRVGFLAELCAELGASANCVCARAEELSREEGFRDGFDFAVSRAVAELGMLSELCLPFVKPGGAFIAMKSQWSDAEAAEAAGAIQALGGVLERVVSYELPFAGQSRRLIVVRKLTPTPEKYPRRYSRIKKTPL